MNVFDLVAKITLDTSEYESGLSEASNKTSSFSDSMKSVGSSVSNVGSTLTEKISRPLLNIGKNLLQAGMDYEAGMDEVQAISGAAANEIKALGDEAMRMASQTKFSTAESAEAYKYMAMAGWKTNDMLNSLSAVMYLAGASGESLGATSDIVTDAMTAFGLAADGTSKVLKDGYMTEVSNAQRFTDVLAAASNNSNTNVSMLGESFKYVAPVAGAMGYSIEDVAIALGLMANSGVKASMSGTALRSILTNMASPTDKMYSAMQTLGVSLTDDEGKMYSLKEVLEQLRAGFGGGQMDAAEFANSMGEIQSALDDGTMSEEEYEEALDELMQAMYGVDAAQKSELASMLAGKYAMAGLLAIVGASEEDYNKLSDAIYNSNGATEEMYNIMTDNAQGAVTMLDSAINVLYTSLSEHIIPAFTDVVRWVTDVVNRFNSLDDSTKKLILTIAGIAIAIGPALTAIGNVISAVGTISGAFSGLAGIVKGVGGVFSSLFSILMANPIVLVIAAIAALVAGFVLLWNNCEGFRNFWIGLWDKLKEVVSGAIDAIVGFFSGIIDFVKNNWQNILLFIVNPFAGAFKLIYDNCEAFRNFIDGLMESVKELFAAGWKAVKGFFASAWDAVVGVWNAATGFFGGLWGNIKNAASTAANAIGDVLSGAWNAVKSVWDGAMSFFGGIWDNIKGVFSGAWETFKNIGKNIVDGIKNGISNAWSALTKWVKDKFDSLVGGVKNMLGIHSPSRVFAGIGGNMALGLGEGWNDEYSDIKKKIESGLNFGTASVGLSVNSDGNNARSGAQNSQQAGVSGAGNTYVTINSPVAVDAVEASRTWKKEMQRMALGYV